MSSLDVAQAEKKFRSVGKTQDSIQSLTLWIIHHKTQHEKLVEIWFKVLKKSKQDHRLVLLYVCNDVVQTCRRKHAVVYKDAFKEILRDASLLVRDNSIKANVKRIYKIWKDRGIYEEEYIDDLIDIIDNAKVQPTVASKLLAEFQPLTLMEKVITLNRYENELEHKRRQLVNLRMDASSLEAIRQLKDKKHGKDFCQEFETACAKMDEYVKCVEREIADRNELIELLEQSELYYDAQYGEAKIVANAYKTFGVKVSALQRQLNDKLRALPSSTTPPYTPPNDVGYAHSSPDVTPPRVEDITSPKQNSDEAQSLFASSKTGGDSNVEAVDMDLSDGEVDTAASNALGHNEESYSPKSDGAPQASPIIDRPSAGMSGLVPGVVQDASQTFFGKPDIFSAVQKEVGNTEEAGGSTPVMDEDHESEAFLEKERKQKEHDSRKDERKEQHKNGERSDRYERGSRGEERRRRDSEDRDRKAEPPKTKTNPIDFLTSLINAKPSSGGSSTSSFLQNMGIGNKTEQQPAPSQSSSSDGSWANWKANEAAPPMPPFGAAPAQPPLPFSSAPPAPPFPPVPASAPYSAAPPPFPPTFSGGNTSMAPSMNGAHPYPGPPPPIPPTPPISSPSAGPPGYAPHGMQPPMRSPAVASTPLTNAQPSFPHGSQNNQPLHASQPPFHGQTPQANVRPSLSIPSSAPFQAQPPGLNTSPTSASYPPNPRGPFPAGSPQTPPSYPPNPPRPPGNYAQPPRFPPQGSNNAFPPPRNNYPGGTPNNQSPHPAPGSGPSTPLLGPPPRASQDQGSTPPPWARTFSGHNKTNLTTIQTVEYSGGDNQGSFASDPGGEPGFQPRQQQQFPGGGNARPLLQNPGSGPGGPRQPLMSGPQGPPPPRLGMDERAPGASGEGQMEFIDKLRRKSGDPPPTPPFDRQNSSSSNLRTLTEVDMDTDQSGAQPDAFSIGSFLSNMRKESNDKNNFINKTDGEMQSRDQSIVDSSPSRVPPWQHNQGGPRPPPQNDWRPQHQQDTGPRPFRGQRPPRFEQRFPMFRGGRPQNQFGGPRGGNHW